MSANHTYAGDGGASSVHSDLGTPVAYGELCLCEQCLNEEIRFGTAFSYQIYAEARAEMDDLE